jgi:hypothetical protein
MVLKLMRTWEPIDRVILLLLVLLCLLPTMKYSFSVHPAEDAAMLLRYSRHLADGHGIAWNIGERPVDGATDFLFMVLLAVLAKIGLSLEFATHMVGAVSHILTVAIVYTFARRFYRSPRWAAFLPAGYLAIGPGMGYAAAGFGTPFFTLFVCITWCLATILAWGRNGRSRTTAVLFAASGLVMSLIRPEGVFMSMLMLLAIVYIRGVRRSRNTIACFLGVFLLFGGAYLCWRWRYFGYPLPNPYYKKGGFHLHLRTLVMSLSNTIFLCLPFVPIILAGFYTSKTARQAIFALIPVLGFTGLWVLMSNEMNYLMRFQYPVLPIILISGSRLIMSLAQKRIMPHLRDIDARSRAVSFSVTGVVLACFIVIQQTGFIPESRPHDGLYDVAVMLRAYSDKRYTIATTEAGLLPFYSNWNAIDAWGLNDQWIAHNSKITESYLDRYKPQVIMFHAYFSPLINPEHEGMVERPDWLQMTMTLKAYAEKRNYILAASFGMTPDDTHYYFVRSDFPESMEIANRIRGMAYLGGFPGNQPDVDYAALRFTNSGTGQQMVDIGTRRVTAYDRIKSDRGE